MVEGNQKGAIRQKGRMEEMRIGPSGLEGKNGSTPLGGALQTKYRLRGKMPWLGVKSYPGGEHVAREKGQSSHSEKEVFISGGRKTKRGPRGETSDVKAFSNRRRHAVQGPLPK